MFLVLIEPRWTLAVKAAGWVKVSVDVVDVD